jgi:hypothetical protein
MTPAVHSQTKRFGLRGPSAAWKAIRIAFVPFLWLVLGIAVGTLVGSVAQRGLASTFERIAPAPIYSLIRLLMWGLAFLLISCLWRVPRRSLVGKHDLGVVPCFVAGAFTGTLHYLAVVLLYDLELMTINWSHSTTQVLIVIVLFFASAMVTVECEACISRRMARRSHPTKT